MLKIRLEKGFNLSWYEGCFELHLRRIKEKCLKNQITFSRIRELSKCLDGLKYLRLFLKAKKLTCLLYFSFQWKLIKEKENDT